MIVVPSHLASSGGSVALEAVLAHELVHVKRWDDLAICLQELVRIVHGVTELTSQMVEKVRSVIRDES